MSECERCASRGHGGPDTVGRTRVDQRITFDEVADAHRLGESGGFMGKLLLVYG